MPMHEHITPAQAELIESAPLFFTASVDPEHTVGPSGEGPVNLSPKGMTRLHILAPDRVAYLDYPGSGNETARHADASGPMTIMVMSMDASDAAIVRLYGVARRAAVQDHPEAARLLEGAPPKARQVIEMRVEKTQTSCGYGVPVYEFVGPRPREGRGRRYWD